MTKSKFQIKSKTQNPKLNIGIQYLKFGILLGFCRGQKGWCGHLLRTSGLKLRVSRATRGFGLIEALVGVSIITVFLVGVVGAARISSRLIENAESQLQATFLLEEGIDAIKGIRDSGWASNIASLTMDTDYFLVFSGGAWALNVSAQPFIDGKFDRRMQISAVSRGASDDIVESGGSVDANTKRVAVRVSWSERGATTTATLSTYITNLFNN